MRKIQYRILLATGIILLGSCHSKQPHETNNIPRPLVTTTGDSTRVASQITYDVIIKNPNSDDTWTSSCLRGLNRQTWVDEIFKGLYEGKLTALDYNTNKPLRLKDIRRFEKNIEQDRSRIAKVQFTENWYFDTLTYTMNKQVHSIILGYEVYNDKGNVRGYKPAFRINLNRK